MTVINLKLLNDVNDDDNYDDDDDDDDDDDEDDDSDDDDEVQILLACFMQNKYWCKSK